MWATYFMTFGSFRKKEGYKNGKRNNRNDSKRLIFRYVRKIPDYFSVAGAP